MKKPLLIGQAPSRRGSPEEPLNSKRLAALSGLERYQFLVMFERRNLLREWPGKNGKGDAFPMDEARRAAAQMEPDLAGRRVVFMGRGAADAFRLCAEYLDWREVFPARSGAYLAAVMPHPSGVNTWWNSKKNTEAAERFMREMIR